MKHIKKIKIDIDKKNFEVIPSVQYDSNTRYLHIQLLNDSVPFDITGCSVILSGVKEDGNSIFNSCDIINSEIGFIQAEVTEQMNAIPGYIDCEIKIYNGEGVLTSKKFTIKVTASQTSREVVSSNEFKALTDALTEVQGIDNKFGEVYEHLDNIETKKANNVDLEVERNRINLLVKVNSGQTDGNTELLDIRNGATGEVYGTAGDAVRDQLKAKLEKDFILNDIFSYELGSYSTLGIKQDSTNRIRIGSIINVNVGDSIINKNRELIKYTVIDINTGTIYVNLGSSSTGYTFEKSANIAIYGGYVDNREIENFNDFKENIILIAKNILNKDVKNIAKKNYTGIIDDEFEKEVVDARESLDGQKYNNLGESIRNQVKSRLEKTLVLNNILNYELGAYSISGNKEESNTRIRVSTPIKFRNGDYIVNNDRNLIKYCLIDADNNTVYVNLNSSSTSYTFSKDATVYMYGGYTDNRLIENFNDFINNLVLYGNDISTKIISDCAYEFYCGESIEPEKIESPYSSIKWTLFGDSLTDGSNSYATKRYFDFIAEELGIQKSNITNLAVSGSGYKRTNSNFMTRVDKMPINSNLITIFGSLNDCNSNVNYAFGTATDTGTDTLGGCINTTIDLIINRCPLAKIIIFSPTPWSIYKNSDKDNRAWKYINLLKEICELRNIKFKDLYTTSNLFPWDNRHNVLFHENNEINNVHPNSNGHKMFYPIIREAIKEVY